MMKQPFASPKEALAHLSEAPWSDYTKADYSIEQWHSACLIHIHDEAPTAKSQCKLPVKTPDGALNRNGVHAAAAALAGARGGLKGVSDDQRQKAASALKRYYTQLDEDPPESLTHHGVKGMRWGVRKSEDTSSHDIAVKNEATKRKVANLAPGTPEFQQVIERVTRTDKPQVLGAQRVDGRVQQTEKREGGQKKGLSNEQKILLTFGAVSVAAAGYYAYSKYSGNKMPNFDPEKVKQEFQQLDKLTLPAKWDTKGLKNGPISAQKLGDLAGGEFNAKLHDVDNLVINTSRGYADILPKSGFSNPFAAEQHASVTRVLEEMRDKYPAIRNMNVEVVPMSKVPGMEGSQAHMAVMAMRAGEARVMYNDTMKAPSAAVIRANKRFLPGLGAKDYVAYHEMGHLLAVANGDLPPAFDILAGKAGHGAMNFYSTTEPLLHKRTLAQHGFTFKELSKLSNYAATEPAEAMAELAGHYFTPEMRSRLTPDQLRRAETMFNQMGGLT